MWQIKDEIFSSAGHNMDWTSYHPVADMQDYMAYLVETYSDFVSVVSIGKSYEGNDMQVRYYYFFV
jgi:Zinc carboxypeptidase